MFGKEQRNDFFDEVVVCCRNPWGRGCDSEVFTALELQGTSQARPGLVDADAEGAYPGCDLRGSEGFDAFASSFDLGELVGGDADAFGHVLEGRVKFSPLEEKESRERAGVVAVVLDAADGYGYVRREDREKWQVSETELFDQAQKNLERTAREITLHEGRSSDKLLAIQENDGYDAARILVPSVRKHAAELLGEPFLVGIPHRDFIVMWSTTNSPEFHRSTRDTLASDFATQPYSISGDVFEVWADGRIQRAK